MFDLITIGTISADLYFDATDLTRENDRLALAIGGKYRSDEFHMTVGGGGANVAIGARKLGLKTGVIGLVGNNVFRKGILQRLDSAKVNTNYLLFSQTGASVSTILLQPSGERTVIAYQSSHEHVIEELHSAKHIPKTRAVYFGNLSHVSVRERCDLMRRLKKTGVTIVVNIGPLDCCKPKTYSNELLEHADVLVLNTHEYADLVKKDLEQIQFQKSQLVHLPIMKKKILIITDGANGSYGYEGEKVFHVPIVKAKKIIDTTGVGDGYTAGFISSFLGHEDVLRAMKSGARYASKILGRIGAN